MRQALPKEEKIENQKRAQHFLHVIFSTMSWWRFMIPYISKLYDIFFIQAFLIFFRSLIAVECKANFNFLQSCIGHIIQKKSPENWALKQRFLVRIFISRISTHFHKHLFKFEPNFNLIPFCIVCWNVILHYHPRPSLKQHEICELSYTRSRVE